MGVGGGMNVSLEWMMACCLSYCCLFVWHFGDFAQAMAYRVVGGGQVSFEGIGGLLIIFTPCLSVCAT